MIKKHKVAIFVIVVISFVLALVGSSIERPVQCNENYDPNAGISYCAAYNSSVGFPISRDISGSVQSSLYWTQTGAVLTVINGGIYMLLLGSGYYIYKKKSKK